VVKRTFFCLCSSADSLLFIGCC